MLSPIEKLGYSARQGARVAWYMGHYFASQRYRQAGNAPKPQPKKPTKPSLTAEKILTDLAALFRRDLANADAGIYPLPNDHDGNLRDILRRSRMFFADLPVAAERKQAKRGDEVYSHDLATELPAYFLQNFHYQTGGYLTEESAELYDLQVEVLFSGSANAMRRQCLVPLADYMYGRDQRHVKMADIACGTGRFLHFVKQAYPKLNISASDLSEAYLEAACDHLRAWPDIDYVHANAEKLPFDDSSLDIVTSIYLFHEVPPKVRRIIAAEFARVLKPGGRLIFMDSLQLGDKEGYDGFLKNFPANFHEPFYGSYIKEDLKTIFEDAGLVVKEQSPVFLSKLVVANKPE